MKYLIDVTESYRVDSEAEVNQLIEEAKESKKYELKKYSRAYKEKKQRGEILESWYKVTLLKQFTEERFPTGQVTIEYSED